MPYFCISRPPSTLTATKNNHPNRVPHLPAMHLSRSATHFLFSKHHFSKSHLAEISVWFSTIFLVYSVSSSHCLFFACSALCPVDGIRWPTAIPCLQPCHQEQKTAPCCAAIRETRVITPCELWQNSLATCIKACNIKYSMHTEKQTGLWGGIKDQRKVNVIVSRLVKLSEKSGT